MDKELEAFLYDYHNHKLPEPAVKTNVDVAEKQRVLCRLLTMKRLKLPMTQQQLARNIGTSQSAIARLEAGQGNPNLHTILKVCEHLKVTLMVQ